MMGIYGLESLECGCKIRHYSGGMTIREGCNNHKTTTTWICSICNQEFTKKRMRKHRWEHAL